MIRNFTCCKISSWKCRIITCAKRTCHHNNINNCHSRPRDINISYCWPINSEKNIPLWIVGSFLSYKPLSFDRQRWPNTNWIDGPVKTFNNYRLNQPHGVRRINIINTWWTPGAYDHEYEVQCPRAAPAMIQFQRPNTLIVLLSRCFKFGTTAKRSWLIAVDRR